MSWVGPSGVPTSSRVDIATVTNATWADAFQFDPTGPTGCPAVPGQPSNWTLNGRNFVFSIKGNWGQTGPLLTVDSGPTGQQLISIISATDRIIGISVPDYVMNGVSGATGATGQGLIPGTYFYDLIMYDGSTPSVKIPLMHGAFQMKQGIGNP